MSRYLPQYADPFTGHGTDLSGHTGTTAVPLGAGVFRGGERWRFQSVFSPFWRLYHAEHRHNRVIHEGTAWPVHSRALLLVPDDLQFDCDSAPGRDASHLWIHFRLSPHGPRSICAPFHIPLAPWSWPLVHRLVQALDSRRKRPSEIHHLAAAVLDVCLMDERLHRPVVPPEPLVRVLAHIRQHLLEPGSTAEMGTASLARIAGYSLDYFPEWFARHMGATPARHLARERLKEAARLLAYTDGTIDAISETLGYANRHYFSRAFKREMGVPPAAFRSRFR